MNNLDRVRPRSVEKPINPLCSAPDVEDTCLHLDDVLAIVLGGRVEFFHCSPGLSLFRASFNDAGDLYLSIWGWDSPHDVVWNQGQTETGFGNPIRILSWMVHDALSTQLRPVDLDARTIMGKLPQVRGRPPVDSFLGAVSYPLTGQ